MHIYRNIYENVHGPIPKDEDGRSYEIHHIDGDRNNNNIENLQCVSIQEHYDIHLSQGDYSACMLILLRMKTPAEDISSLARKSALERWENGTHNFIGLNQKRVEEGTHNFLDRKAASERNKKRVADGTHCLLKQNGGSEKATLRNFKRLEKGNHPSQKKKECPHCGVVCSVTVYARWHGDKCKHKL